MTNQGVAQTQFPHFVVALICCVALCVLGVITLIVLRERLTPLASTRKARLLLAVLLAAFGLVSPWLYEVVDVKMFLSSAGVQQRQINALWALAVLIPVVITIQAFILVHADDAEIHRSRAEAERDDARRERNFFNEVATTFIGVVSDKRRRLRNATTKESLIDALQPQSQITALIQAAYTLFESEINDGGAHQANAKYHVRAVLFRVRSDGQSLEPAEAWDGTCGDCTSGAQLSPYLSLAMGLDKSLVVAAAKRGAQQLVPDATVAHADPKHPFNFFGNDAKHIKSIAAIPIHLGSGDPPPYHVLVVDTNRLGYFDEANTRVSTTVETIQKHLTHRLLLELQVEALCATT